MSQPDATLDAMQKRIDGLEELLARQKVDVKREQAHLTEGSRECLYWHYGYLMALKDLQRLTEPSETRQ